MKARNVFTDSRWLWSRVGERKSWGGASIRWWMDETLWILSFAPSWLLDVFYLQLITAATDPRWRKEKMCWNSGAGRAERWLLINVSNWRGAGARNPLNLFTQSQSLNWSPNNFRLPILLLLASDLQASLMEFSLPKPIWTSERPMENVRPCVWWQLLCQKVKQGRWPFSKPNLH